MITPAPGGSFTAGGRIVTSIFPRVNRHPAPFPGGGPGPPRRGVRRSRRLAAGDRANQPPPGPQPRPAETRSTAAPRDRRGKMRLRGRGHPATRVRKGGHGDFGLLTSSAGPGGGARSQSVMFRNGPEPASGRTAALNRVTKASQNRPRRGAHWPAPIIDRRGEGGSPIRNWQRRPSAAGPCFSHRLEEGVMALGLVEGRLATVPLIPDVGTGDRTVLGTGGTDRSRPDGAIITRDVPILLIGAGVSRRKPRRPCRG